MLATSSIRTPVVLREGRRGSGWAQRTLWAGAFVSIKAGIEMGSHAVELHGNSAEGWAIYMHTVTMPNAVVQVSPIFSREQGDTRAMLIDACERAYGVRPKHTVKYL